MPSARIERAGVSLDGVDPTIAFPNAAKPYIDGWIDDATDALIPPLTAVNCLINPAVVLIGGRLPDEILDRLAEASNRKLRAMAPNLPALAPMARATLSRDAPAVGAAILPFLDRILPSDSILIKS